jgi:hypothetical protein
VHLHRDPPYNTRSASWRIEASVAQRFELGPACPVPANKRYVGKFHFAKHFHQWPI